MKHINGWATMLQEIEEKDDVIANVSRNMPPTFIWHTRTDGIVPISQSLELINKMNESEVPYEAHIFYEGYHGLSTNDVLSNYHGALQGGYTPFNVSEWTALSRNWINHLCGDY